MSSCQAQLSDEIRRFEAVANASVALTIVSVLVRVAMKRKMDEHPRAASYGFFASSFVKILLAILLFTVLHPTCPTNCICGDLSQTYVYPSIVLVIGALWAAYGYKYYKKSQEQQGGKVQTTVSTSDIV